MMRRVNSYRTPATRRIGARSVICSRFWRQSSLNGVKRRRVRHERPQAKTSVAQRFSAPMPILVGFGFALVLLYLWLLGHWFARVVMVLTLAVLFSAALCWSYHLPSAA